MPRYQVFAAQRDTGADLTLLIDADAPSSAARHANEQGFLVRSVEEVTPPVEPAPAIDFDDDATRAAIGSLARSIIQDKAFSKRLGRIIARNVASGVAFCILFYFILLPILIVLFFALTGMTIQSILNR
jgi:hypothetical protein